MKLSVSSASADIGGLVQDCSISIANALEILQSCTEPSICRRRDDQVKSHTYTRPAQNGLRSTGQDLTANIHYRFIVGAPANRPCVITGRQP